ncbi:MAG: class II fumarate hydratase [Microthrixaceae bacterium]
MTTRIEHDSLGEMEVPADALWQAQTQRAVLNFPVSGKRVDPALILALIGIKSAAARANSGLGVIDDDTAAAIVDSATELVGDADRDRHFPVDVFQTGSGTSTNMNVNEVLATLATRRRGSLVHPNDHVNASQSSNDTFPSAIHIAAVVTTVNETIPALEVLAAALHGKEAEFAEVVKSGRTHLMDAVPITLGQEFGGYAEAIDLGMDRLRDTLGRVGALPLGGTAVGTGLNAPAGFAKTVIEILATELGVELHEAHNHFEAQGGQDALVELSGACRVVAVSLYKIAADLRWMSSGPSTGLREIHLPELQPGSSIMPGKINPVMPEAVQQVVAQVIGNDAAVAFGGTAGTLELNVMMPVMASNLLESLRLVANVSRLLADRCISGITANHEVLERYSESSPALVTALVPLIGYEAAAMAAHDAIEQGRTVREVVIESGLASADKVNEVLDPLAMTRGGVMS